ncbi:MAG: hydrogenase formation protein HypD [Magnetococcales bacterium]|nr:hydrogenase formation protein HypD [Magnetococcales bacterium]
MNYIEGFRDPAVAAHYRDSLARLGAELAHGGKDACFMEVCGSHTMAIARFGIRGFLPSGVRLVSGPGCPVCVTDPGYVDAAISLAEAGRIIVTFGDMMRVPGSRSTLAQARAMGYAIESVYSSATAMELARTHPDQEVVFLAVGFETTVAPVVAMLDGAIRQRIGNLSLLTAFKRVPPVLDALLVDPGIRIDGFLCPAHVSAIIGADAYRPYAATHGVACVVSGFEPLDILQGVEGLLQQRVAGRAFVDNQYNRVVRPGGNPQALGLMERYLEPVEVSWRGLGVIPASGFKLRSHLADYDACIRFGIDIPSGRPNPRCLCGEVLKGKIMPSECGLFGVACTPEKPLGPCMVSSEGSCAAEYRFASLKRRDE